MSEAPTTTGVIPSFFVEAVEPLEDFYVRQLGFDRMMGVVGKDGKLDFAIVHRGPVSIMIGRPEEPMHGLKANGERPVQIYCYVEDVDDYYAELQKRRVAISKPIETPWWGDRLFSVRDPNGYTVWFCQTVAEPKPPAGVKMI